MCASWPAKREPMAGRRRRFTFSDVEFKGAGNLVSYVDKQTERTLVERLKAHGSRGAEFVTEEGTVSAAGGASSSQMDRRSA